MEGARAAVVATAIPAAVAEPKAARNLARRTTVGNISKSVHALSKDIGSFGKSQEASC